MNLTVFQYITDIPDVITDYDYYLLACKAYNLGLTLVWMLLFMFLINKLFVCFQKFYTRGHE